MKNAKVESKTDFDDYMKKLAMESAKSQKTTKNPIKIMPTPIHEMKVISSELIPIEIPQKLMPQKEWVKKLKIWFAQIRVSSINNRKVDNSIKLVDIMRSIESGEDPQLHQVQKIRNPFRILEYFSNKINTFTKSDLAWIFSCLTLVDVIFSPEQSEILQKISYHSKQMIIANEDMLTSYLLVIIILIHDYFEQP